MESTQLLEQVLAGAAPGLVRLTVDQYEQFTEAGILLEGSPIELIDGLMIYKDRRDGGSEELMNHGPVHAATVNRLLGMIYEQLTPSQACVRSQTPVRIRPHNEPEPDLSIMIGPQSRYDHRHPQPADTMAVFEVADRSRRYDRTTKYRIYAEAQIGVFVLADLKDRVLEVYQSPSATGEYRQCDKYTDGQTATLTLTEDVQVTLAVDEVFGRK